MKNNNPLVSIIIPVFNGERFLAEAIENVMQQTYQPIEIFIVDDGSTDETKNIARQYQKYIKYFYQTNKGSASARNLAIKNAQGNFIAFLDVDDLWPKKDKLERQVDFLIHNPKIDIVMGLVEIIELADVIQTTKKKITLLGRMLCRKELFSSDKVGHFDESLICAEDLDWYIRALELNIQIKLINEVTLYYRMHAHNITNLSIQMRKNDDILDNVWLYNKYSYSHTKVIKKFLDRRKRNPKLYDNFIKNFMLENFYNGKLNAKE